MNRALTIGRLGIRKRPQVSHNSSVTLTNLNNRYQITQYEQLLLHPKRYYPSSSSSSHDITNANHNKPITPTSNCNDRNKSSGGSGSPNEATIDNGKNQKQPNDHNYVKLDPRAIFPWRHSSQPLPRLIPNSIEFETQGGYIGPRLPPFDAPFRGVVWLCSSVFLGSGIFNYFEWKRRLEEGFQLAFAVAVQGLLMDVYCVANNDDADTKATKNNNEIEDAINYDSENDTIDAIPTIQYDNIIDTIPEDQLPVDLNHDKSIQSQTRNMLDSHLIGLYKTAHECMKHKLHIHLQSTPKSAQIMSFVLIPFTKEEVITTPALKHSCRDIWKELQQAEYEVGSAVYQFNEIFFQRHLKRRGVGMIPVTVIAQVAIECDEIFKVVDVESGQVIQGDPEGQMKEVTHLVRFEIVVDLDPKTGKTELGSWQITDWDDLLDGNVWFY